jgi:3-deoxy-manno-octulosonate cytidylyltransferase (CMP-KDO synthetase)
VTSAVCIIPARMASSRFPGKPMVDLLGLPLILHVWHRCRLAKGLDRVVVATCDQVIFDAVVAAGGEAVMTAATHPGCVDRTVEAVTNLRLNLTDEDLVLMVQGDEVLVTPEMIEQMLKAYVEKPAPVVNLASLVLSPTDHDDHNCVKVCLRPDGRAMFFSRSPIPSRSRSAAFPPVYQQTGVIAFSRAFLSLFGQLSRTPLEMVEQIDMMRTLEHGYDIRVVVAERETIGVDTPADRDRAEILLRADPVTFSYMDLSA